MTTNVKARALRAHLAKGEFILAPGIYDGISARVADTMGFPALYMTGYGATASMLGLPDAGLATYSDMVGRAEMICSVIQTPLIADADTGYGNAINVIRSVQLYEQAGVAGFHLEDQVTPKKCGHMENKQVVSRSEAVAKIRAAVAARQNADTVIIARTDARAVEGVEAAIDRAKAFHDAGADVLFVEALQGEGEIERVADALRGRPLLFNWAEGGKTPPLPIGRIRELGFAIVICPIAALLSATAAMRATYASIRQAGTPVGVVDQLLPFGEFTTFVGLPEINSLEQRFAD